MNKKKSTSNTLIIEDLVNKTVASEKVQTFIILTMVPQAIHIITAVLDIPNGYLQKGEKAKKVIDRCEGNPWVTIDAAVIAAYRADLKAYTLAETTSERDTAWLKVAKDLKKLIRLFQSAADDDPENAITIIESGDFRVKKVAIHQKNIFGATNGVDSGTIDLVGPTTDGRHLHDWWISLDGINFKRFRPTLEATTSVTGLTPGTTVWFKHELIVTKNGTGLSNAIEILVK